MHAVTAALGVLGLVVARYEHLVHGIELIGDPPDCHVVVVGARPIASQYQLLIMVWDGNPQMPVKKLAAPDDLDGRGLMIVEALSDACGAAPGLDGGKIVWARLLVSGQCS